MEGACYLGFCIDTAIAVCSLLNKQLHALLSTAHCGLVGSPTSLEQVCREPNKTRLGYNV